MKQLTLNGKTLGVIDVPEEKDSYVNYYHIGLDNNFYENYGQYDVPKFQLPPGHWSILGRLDSITEEQAAMIMPKQYLPDLFGMGYQSYPENDYNNNTATESLQSFFRSHGIEGNPLIILNEKV